MQFDKHTDETLRLCGHDCYRTLEIQTSFTESGFKGVVFQLGWAAEEKDLKIYMNPRVREGVMAAPRDNRDGGIWIKPERKDS